MPNAAVAQQQSEAIAGVKYVINEANTAIHRERRERERMAEAEERSRRQAKKAEDELRNIQHKRDKKLRLREDHNLKQKVPLPKNYHLRQYFQQVK